MARFKSDVEVRRAYCPSVQYSGRAGGLRIRSGSMGITVVATYWPQRNAKWKTMQQDLLSESCLRNCESLDKLTGGLRPIGLVRALVRLFGRIHAWRWRRWAVRWARAYFNVGRGRRTTDNVWRQAFRAEVRRACMKPTALLQ